MYSIQSMCVNLYLIYVLLFFVASALKVLCEMQAFHEDFGTCAATSTCQEFWNFVCAVNSTPLINLRVYGVKEFRDYNQP